MGTNKRKISEWFLQNLYLISNKEYQKKIWIEAAGPECQDFDEAVNDFFDDGDDILEKYLDYGLTQIQYQVLKKFRDEFDFFVKKNHFPEEFIDSPEWAKIMDLAKDVLKAFNFQKKIRKNDNSRF